MRFRPSILAAAAAAVALVTSATAGSLCAQPAPAFPNPPITLDGKGITIFGVDSVTKLNLRFRVQELFSATSETESDLSVKRTQFAIRRMRLRLEGVLKDPRLRVNVQLSFARGDMDQENTSFANVLRDAYVTWQFTPHLAASFGQAKLPGNRQRQVSSAEIQSPDRSQLNALFTVDRDVGIFTSYSRDISGVRFVARGAVSSGEGRNPAPGDGGLAYTGRFEVLPFGAFTNGGDYVESDLARERTPKLSLAVAASHNDRAIRTGGQLGAMLYEPRSMNTYFADALFKYRGVALQSEYAHRTSPDPVTMSGSATRFVYAGEALMMQASWLLPRHDFEPVVRHTIVTPAQAIRAINGGEAIRESSFGLSKYFHGHRIKTNGDVIYTNRTQLMTGAKQAEWTMRLGFEAGI